MTVSKIVIQMNGQEIAVTVEEAKKLYSDLGELFAKPLTFNTPCFRRHADDFYISPLFKQLYIWTAVPEYTVTGIGY